MKNKNTFKKTMYIFGTLKNDYKIALGQYEK